MSVFTYASMMTMDFFLELPAMRMQKNERFKELKSSTFTFSFSFFEPDCLSLNLKESQIKDKVKKGTHADLCCDCRMLQNVI